MGTILAVLNAIIALPKILDEIKLAIGSLEGAVAKHQAAEFQAALAKFQQDVSGAKETEDYAKAARSLHDVLTHL